MDKVKEKLLEVFRNSSERACVTEEIKIRSKGIERRKYHVTTFPFESESLKKKNRELLYNRFRKILESGKDIKIFLWFLPEDVETVWEITITFLPEEDVKFCYGWHWCHDGHGLDNITLKRENQEWYYRKHYYDKWEKITELTKRIEVWI